MNKQNKKREALSKEERIARTRRTVIVITAVFLSAVLLLGIGIGTAVAIEDARAFAKYGGTRADKGVTSYLLSTYKSYYMRSEVGAVDTPEYWSEEIDGVTRGELLRESADNYVRAIIAGAYLFDRYTKLEAYEKSSIRLATEEVLAYRADGSERRFNELTEAMGFDYDDFCRATELIYKAERAMSVIYGADGAALTNVSDATVLALCNAYYNRYSRVKILYIDTKETVVKDKDGKIEMGSDELYKTEYLTGAEIVERRADIAEIRSLIEGANTGVGEEMSPEYFDLMQEKYNITDAYNESGYYFSPSSAFAAGFARDSSELLPSPYSEAMNKMLGSVVEASFAMNEGEYREIEGDYGIAFIYKCEKEEGAYLSTYYGAFFHDFYSDAAVYLYNESVSEIAKDVTIRKKHNEIDIIKIPYNYEFVAKIQQ